jgi:hypothetical protein
VRTKDSCWSVGTIYDPSELPGVSTVGPGIGRGVTSGIRADPRGFTGMCGLGGSVGLTDEDVGLLRGVDCDILAPGMVISWPKA